MISSLAASSQIGFGLAEGGASTAPLAPYSGYSLWLRADAGVLDGTGAAAADGSSVATWRDQSGNGYDATQATARQRPALKAGILNGHPVIRHLASGPQLLANSHNFASPFTAIVVAQAKPSPDNRRILSGIGNNWLLGWWNFAYDQAFFGGVVKLDATPAVTIPIWKCYAGKGDSTTGYLYSAGSLLASSGANAGPNGVSLGGTSGEPSDCDIAEVLIYPSALSDAHRATTEHYLSMKYALGF